MHKRYVYKYKLIDIQSMVTKSEKNGSQSMKLKKVEYAEDFHLRNRAQFRYYFCVLVLSFIVVEFDATVGN